MRGAKVRIISQSQRFWLFFSCDEDANCIILPHHIVANGLL